MKFAFCLFKYFPSGGLQRGFLQLAQVCAARGHQIDVYTGSWEGERPENLNISIVPHKGLTNHRRYQSMADRLEKLFASRSYNVIAGFNKMPGLDIYFASDTCFAANARKRSILYRMSGRCRTLMRLEESVFHKNSRTHIITISDNEKQRYMAYYKTPEHRFHSVPPGIARDRLTGSDSLEIRENLRREFGITPDQALILMVGSDYKRKGVDRTIKAVSALPSDLKKKTRLFVLGKGKPGPLIRLSRQKKVASLVTFLGERSDVPRFLAGADILLHPARQENTGTVLIEAMAAGLPVLATEICGYGFHIKKAEAGELVPDPFIQENLNQKLIHMLRSDKRKKWKDNAKAYIRTTDVYSRHEKAADIIEAAALR